MLLLRTAVEAEKRPLRDRRGTGTHPGSQRGAASTGPACRRPASTASISARPRQAASSRTLEASSMGAPCFTEGSAGRPQADVRVR